MGIEREKPNIGMNELLALLGRYRIELATIATERDVLRLQLGAKDKEIDEVVTRLHTELLNSRLSMIAEQEEIWLRDHEARAAHISKHLKRSQGVGEPGFEVIATTDEHSIPSHPTGEDHGDD